MNKIIIIITTLVVLCNDIHAQYQAKPKENNQPEPTVHYSGTTVIVGFDMYDNKGIAAQLVNEENNTLNIIFPDDNVTCTLDNKGNILEGESYITQKSGGKPIAFIQIYETKKKIVNPTLDMNKTLGNFMLIEMASGNVIFGNGDYNASERSFLLYAKPLSKRIKLKPDNGLWKVTYSDDTRLNTSSNIAALYLYSSTTRRFYTAK